MISEPQHRSLVIEYNRSAAAYPANKTIIELFAEQAEFTPHAEAIRFGTRSLTYRKLDEHANQVAAHLRNMGAQPGRLVVILLEHSIEAVGAILGVLKSGAAYIPLDPATPKARVAAILRDVAKGTGGTVPVLLTQEHLSGGLRSEAANLFTLDEHFATVSGCPVFSAPYCGSPQDLAYIIYTSGSTGTPKGVMIENRSLVNYVWWAKQQYSRCESLTWPLFSSLAFDLTVTSIFVPLVSGGRIVVYREDPRIPGTAVSKVVEDNLVDIVKLTPSHLALVSNFDLSRSKIRKFIVGGEEFKTELARDITRRFAHPIEIYNEYGPTEATVGCMIHRYDSQQDVTPTVPVGVPAANCGIYILDEQFKPVPPAVVGEMYLAGDCLARGYLNHTELTEQKFPTIGDPRQNDRQPAGCMRVFKTGDIAKWRSDGLMEFLGRRDHQVKIGGARVELGDIEAHLLEHTEVHECVVSIFSEKNKHQETAELSYCGRCGLPSSFPGATLDAAGVCNICLSFESYADKAQAYFKTPNEFNAVLENMRACKNGEYDCLVLYSGGKDSSFMLYQLCNLGVKPLAFTLDNGFISEEAKANIRRVVHSLGVDHIFGNTPHMKEIFVDSLNRFANVCNGCFKTIYTLATNLALEKGIRHIVTGLSRGQFFETRLTAEVFQRSDFDVAKLDALVLEARRAYHRREDAVSAHLAVDVLHGEQVFDAIEFVDFYRYWSVPLEEMYAYLRARGWTKPRDTGRSTNCSINDLGIYIHKKHRGFHNYALPYSWDVRLNQKTRSEAMEELGDEIDESRVKELMGQIGYVEPPPHEEGGVNRLVAYYVGDRDLAAADLRAHLANALPQFMIPAVFIRLDKLPLTLNGKVDRQALPRPTRENIQAARNQVGPQTETQRSLETIWSQLLNVEHVGIHNEFFELGGHSLLALRAVSRIRDVFNVEIALETVFLKPTIAALAEAIEEAKAKKNAVKAGNGFAPIARQVRRVNKNASSGT